MNELEQVSKDMMAELNKAHSLDEILESWYDGEKYYSSLLSYLKENRFSDEAYLKIIKHINGDTQFEAEKTKKYVVRTKQMDNMGDFRYLALGASYGLTYPANTYAYDVSVVEKFDTREEAEKWTNPLMEVVEMNE